MNEDIYKAFLEYALEKAAELPTAPEGAQVFLKNDQDASTDTDSN